MCPSTKEDKEDVVIVVVVVEVEVVVVDIVADVSPETVELIMISAQVQQTGAPHSPVMSEIQVMDRPRV
ncbi:hypothetical protein E2C01_077610 [Portunus trituberculatus]|uniref:Uncharacterized protein n=1 Tax=Portunus trituberculatus TaxID=210409 RepID=A0A5B7IBU2_PORTR|nr:hypothetical protein [Portunus trituberculatus]